MRRRSHVRILNREQIQIEWGNQCVLEILYPFVFIHTVRFGSNFNCVSFEICSSFFLMDKSTGSLKSSQGMFSDLLTTFGIDKLGKSEIWSGDRNESAVWLKIESKMLPLINSFWNKMAIPSLKLSKSCSEWLGMESWKAFYTFHSLTMSVSVNVGIWVQIDVAFGWSKVSWFPVRACSSESIGTFVVSFTL